MVRAEIVSSEQISMWYDRMGDKRFELFQQTLFASGHTVTRERKESKLFFCHCLYTVKLLIQAGSLI